MEFVEGTRDEVVGTLLAAASALERGLDRSLSTIKGISFSEYQLLRALSDSPRSTATRVEVARNVGMTPSGVTRALKPLEKLGFVTTSRDARDARRSLASLTDQGVELVADATGVVADALADLSALDDLSAEERGRFVGFCRELAGV